MIDMPVEKLTAEEFIKAGLMKALYKGQVIIKGKYSVDSYGDIEFKQKAFFFKDKLGDTRLVKFISGAEMQKFLEIYHAEYD